MIRRFCQANLTRFLIFTRPSGSVVWNRCSNGSTFMHFWINRTVKPVKQYLIRYTRSPRGQMLKQVSIIHRWLNLTTTSFCVSILCIIFFTSEVVARKTEQLPKMSDGWLSIISTVCCDILWSRLRYSPHRPIKRSNRDVWAVFVSPRLEFKPWLKRAE